MTKSEVTALVKRKSSIGLDLGCGPNKQKDFIGMDSRKLPGVDIVHDLEKIPWPLPDSCASTVIMSHFWEHIKPWMTLPFMEELHRVCRDGAQVMIAAPYGYEFRFVQDPTHCNPTNEATFMYWDSTHPLWHVYEPSVFHIEMFDIIPASNSRDFNAVLRCCKPGKGKKCPHQNGNT